METCDDAAHNTAIESTGQERSTRGTSVRFTDMVGSLSRSPSFRCGWTSLNKVTSAPEPAPTTTTYVQYKGRNMEHTTTIHTSQLSPCSVLRTSSLLNRIYHLFSPITESNRGSRRACALQIHYCALNIPSSPCSSFYNYSSVSLFVG